MNTFSKTGGDQGDCLSLPQTPMKSSDNREHEYLWLPVLVEPFNGGLIVIYDNIHANL